MLTDASLNDRRFSRTWRAPHLGQTGRVGSISNTAFRKTKIRAREDQPIPFEFAACAHLHMLRFGTTDNRFR